jgi:hypothetical protein
MKATTQHLEYKPQHLLLLLKLVFALGNVRRYNEIMETSQDNVDQWAGGLVLGYTKYYYQE